MSRKPKILLSSVATVALLASLAACSSAPKADSSSARSSYLSCIVSDGPNFLDHSFNELSLDGVIQAAKKMGGRYKKVTSASANDYAANVAALVGVGCNIIAAPGFSLAAPIKAAAKSNPKTDFAMIDDNSINLPNVKSVVFQTDQAAFLGGYIAAAYSKTGIVGTYGGAEYPTVTIYMDGLADGIDYYNKQHNKQVKLLGWNESTQQGSFVGNFTDQNAAKTLTSNFLQQKADVIVPVAGPLYEGSGAAIRTSGTKAVIIGVDADLYLTDTSGYQDLILTSITKNLQPTTAKVIEQAASSKTFDNSQYVGTLKNGGVGLAPFHKYASKIPSSLTAELARVRAGIIDGSIPVTSPSAYKE